MDYKVYKCKNCGSRLIGHLDNLIDDGCYKCDGKNFELIPVSEYAISEIIEMLGDELENWNHHHLCSYIGDVFKHCKDNKVVLLMANEMLKNIGNGNIIE